VRDITTFARELQVQHLTLYSFSRQNWSRSAEEVAGLMMLLEQYCIAEVDTFMKNNLRLQTIGQTMRLPPSTQKALYELVELTKNNTGMILSLALDYGGREEIVHAAQALAYDIQAKRLAPEHVNEASFAQRLYTHTMPDPDLLIRTSGEMRISNFLLWQLAYAELYFCRVRWPDFTRGHFTLALQEYAKRKRRFGGVPSSHTEVTFDDSTHENVAPLSRTYSLNSSDVDRSKVRSRTLEHNSFSKIG
jgi:undecaprenyl diphosphate synthase